MFKIFIAYEILIHDVIVKIEDEKYVLIFMILEHVILLNETLAETCLFQILTSYFRGFLLSVWILFLVKIIYY